MKTAKKKPKKKVTDWNVADRQKALIERDFGLQPTGVIEEGYVYDGPTALKKIIQKHGKKH